MTKQHIVITGGKKVFGMISPEGVITILNSNLDRQGVLFESLR